MSNLETDSGMVRFAGGEFACSLPREEEVIMGHGGMTGVRAAYSVGSSPRSGHPADAIVFVLLVVGFFIGPMKMMGNPWVAYLLPDALVGLAILITFGERMNRGLALFAPSPLTVPILVFAGYCVLEIPNTDSLLRSLLGLRSLLLYLGMYFVGYYSFCSIKQLQRIYALLITLGVITALYGVHQWYAGPQSFVAWSEHYARYAKIIWQAGSKIFVFRAFSTFVAPGTFAGNMAFLMLLAFSVVATGNINVFWRLLALGAFAIMGLGIAVSGSRSPVVYLVLAAAVLPAFLRGVSTKIKPVINLFVVVALTLWFVTSGIESVAFKRFTETDYVSTFWEVLDRVPMLIKETSSRPFGRGLGTTGGIPTFLLGDPLFSDIRARNADTGYGSIALELGLPGVIIVAYFAVMVGIRGFRVWKDLPDGRLKDLLLGTAIHAALFPVFAILVQFHGDVPRSIYLWLLIGILMKASALNKSSHADRLFRPSMYARK